MRWTPCVMDKSRNSSSNAQHAPEAMLVKNYIKSIHLLVVSELLPSLLQPVFQQWRLVMSTGLVLGCESHFRPCHQRLPSCATGPPQLLRYAGFGTYLHVIQFLSQILRTRLCTNCLYSPSPLIQWSATVLFDQQ